MSSAASCGCDESKSWRDRAEAAEAKARHLDLAVRFARLHLERLLTRVDQVLDGLTAEEAEPVTSPEGVIGAIVPASSQADGAP